MAKIDDKVSEDIVKQASQKDKLNRMNDAVRYHENERKLKRIYAAKQQADDLRTIDFDTDFDDMADRAKADAMDRQAAVTFLYEEMQDFVQLAPGSLCLVCAATGTGKSTLTANIAFKLMNDNKKVLVIANEERDTDVAARISCLQLGVSIHDYKRKDGIPDTVREMVLDNIRNFGKNLSIRALNYKDNATLVTSPEGLERMLTDEELGEFDAVIIDYYQNINLSLDNPGLKPFEVNEIFANSIDRIKNKIGCPIILMAQIRRGDEDYKVRLEGRRLILNKCTDIFEIKVDKQNSRSVLLCHKDRWLGNQGEEKFIGYKGGKFIPYTKEFEDSIRSGRADRLEAIANEDDN